MFNFTSCLQSFQLIISSHRHLYSCLQLSVVSSLSPFSAEATTTTFEILSDLPLFVHVSEASGSKDAHLRCSGRRIGYRRKEHEEAFYLDYYLVEG